MHFLKKFFDTANQSAEAVNRQIIRITQRNLDAGLDLAKSLASARDPFEIAKLQASFWWKQFSEFSAQAEEVHKRLFGFSAVPEPTPEPGPHEPASKSITRPHHEHSPAAQDPELPQGQSESLIGEKSIRLCSRPKPQRQLSRSSWALMRDTRDLKKHWRKEICETQQKSRDFARKQGEGKPHATKTPISQVTRADAARPDEGQSRIERGCPSRACTPSPSDGRQIRNARWERCSL